jgi:hypothetical protein
MGRVSKRKSAPKRVLRLLDLEHSKRTLLGTIGSPDSKRAYEFAIDDFVAWYCSEPRLAFSKTVVLRYRLELEARRLAPATINLRLAAVRRLAFEAADTGLLRPELAAGIARVKGAKRIGVRLGNWLTADQSRNLHSAPNVQTLKGHRDRAILADGASQLSLVEKIEAGHNHPRDYRSPMLRRGDREHGDGNSVGKGLT